MLELKFVFKAIKRRKAVIVIDQFGRRFNYWLVTVPRKNI